MTNSSNNSNLKAFLGLNTPVQSMTLLAALFLYAGAAIAIRICRYILYAGAAIAICRYIVLPVFDFIRAHSGLSEYPGIALAFAALILIAGTETPLAKADGDQHAT